MLNAGNSREPIKLVGPMIIRNFFNHCYLIAIVELRWF